MKTKGKPKAKTFKPGEVITRTYKGKEHKVHVTKEGKFRLNGKDYPSLTATAKAITGYASISGPAFFGLVAKESKGS